MNAPLSGYFCVDILASSNKLFLIDSIFSLFLEDLLSLPDVLAPLTDPVCSDFKTIVQMVAPEGDFLDL